MDFLSFRSVAIGICELVLLGALYAAESGLTVWCELLLRICGIRGMGSSSRKLLEKLAFDAVIGVLGVVCWLSCGGGVTAPELMDPAPSYKAAIFAAVGVLSGSKFSGGNRKGCSVLRLMLAAPPTFFSVPGYSSTVRPLLCRPTSAFGIPLSPRPGIRHSVFELLSALALSNGKLVLRAKKKGWSISVLGDSYALGMAGTGGTSSSLVAGALSIRVFNVGSLELEKLCDIRAEPDGFMKEL